MCRPRPHLARRGLERQGCVPAIRLRLPRGNKANKEAARVSAMRNDPSPELPSPSPQYCRILSACQTATVPVADHAELEIGALLSIVRQSRVPRATFELEP
jgi:hypothetical protein